VQLLKMSRIDFDPGDATDELSTVLPDSLTFVASTPSDESLGRHQSPSGWALQT
jgi:hypothetical protein